MFIFRHLLLSQIVRLLSLQVGNLASQPLTVFIENNWEGHKGESKEPKQSIPPSIAQRRIHCWPSQGQEWAEDKPQQIVRAQRRGSSLRAE